MVCYLLFLCALCGSVVNSYKKNKQLRVTEIFYSLQGESQSIGIPTVFIRLTGCPLRCGYCDTSYAFQGGEWMSPDQIMEQVATYTTSYVTVTGGEPLAQSMCKQLLGLLCDNGKNVSLETSGALDVAQVDHRVVKVMDIKTPGSGESDRNLLSNLQYLKPGDQVKFVICDKIDYEWSKDFIKEHTLVQCAGILMSPSYAQLDAAVLAEWILQDQLTVRFQLQLHKVLWGEEHGR